MFIVYKPGESSRYQLVGEKGVKWEGDRLHEAMQVFRCVRQPSVKCRIRRMFAWFIKR